MKRKLPAIKRVGQYGPVRLIWVCVLAVTSLTLSAIAGDPIQFSNDKGKQGPQEERKIDNDLFKGWKQKPTPNPAFGLTPYLPSTRLDRKDEKRLKNARDERKNFLLLEPGELQKDEDDPLSGRAFSANGFEKEENSSDYTFGPLIQGKAGNRQAGSRNDPNGKQPPPQRPSDDSEQGKGDNKKALNILGNKEGQAQGAHTVNELNLKNLIDGSQINTAQGGKGEVSLFQFLRDNAVDRPSREQQERTKNFERFINSGATETVVPAGRFDPINVSPDLTQQRLNPVFPSFGPSPDLPAPSRAPDVSANPWISARSGSALDPARPSPGPSLPSSLFQPPTAPTPAPTKMPTVMAPLFGHEFQRRN